MSKKRRKKSDKTKLKEKTWDAVRKAVFLRDGDTCQRCYKDVTGRDKQPSHVLSKGAYPWLEFDLENVKTLCYRCHLYWWHKNPMDAYEWFAKEFPDRWEYLQQERSNQHKLTEKEIDECLQKALLFLQKKR